VNHAGAGAEQVTARWLQGEKQVKCGSLPFYRAHSPRFWSETVYLAERNYPESHPTVGTDHAIAVKRILSISSISVSYQAFRAHPIHLLWPAGTSQTGEWWPWTIMASAMRRASGSVAAARESISAGKSR